ncbi:MAG: oxidoreductase, partial [Candidatus Bathyarchaeia archaeon]
KAKRLASSENFYTYGDIQNGGTATIYLSNIPFEKIDLKLKESGARFRLPQNVKNRYLSEINQWGKAIIGSAIAGAAIGILGSLIKKNKD